MCLQNSYLLNLERHHRHLLLLVTDRGVRVAWSSKSSSPSWADSSVTESWTLSNAQLRFLFRQSPLGTSFLALFRPRPDRFCSRTSMSSDLRRRRAWLISIWQHVNIIVVCCCICRLMRLCVMIMCCWFKNIAPCRQIKTSYVFFFGSHGNTYRQGTTISEYWPYMSFVQEGDLEWW